MTNYNQFIEKLRDEKTMKNLYTLYNSDNVRKILIHKDTGYYETFPRKSFYRACIDIPCFINAENELYYYLSDELGNKLQLRK